MQQQQRQRGGRVLEYELEEHEMLLWSDRPNPLRVRTGDIIAFIIGLPWTFLGLISLYSLLRVMYFAPTPAVIFTIFVLLYMLPGIIWLLAPLRTYQRTRRTLYAITDRRILIINAGPPRSVKSYRREYVGNIERIERKGERGDLIFGLAKDLRFTDIDNVRRVEQLLYFNR